MNKDEIHVLEETVSQLSYLCENAKHDPQHYQKLHFAKSIVIEQVKRLGYRIAFQEDHGVHIYKERGTK